MDGLNIVKIFKLIAERSIFIYVVTQVPYIIVVGENEKDAKELPVRIRSSGKQENLSVAKLKEMIASETSGMPFEMLPLPKLLTKRPKFVG